MRQKKQLRMYIILLITLLVPLSVELFSRWYMKFAAPPNGDMFHMGGRALAYANSPFYSLEFFEDENRLVQARSAGKDYKGRYFSSIGGIRGTSDQPENAAHTIYLFGNSTVFGYEVPDGYTIASYLQRLVKPQYRVVNMGLPGAGLSINFERLKAIHLNRGDIVIFYGDNGDDGLISVAQRRDRWIGGQLCNTLQSSPLAVVKLYCLFTDKLTPGPLVSSGDKSLMIKFMNTVVAEVNDYTSEAGASFVFILRPHLWSQALTENEHEIADNPLITIPGIEIAYKNNWPIQQRLVKQFNESGIMAGDFTHVLDSVRRRQAIYLDTNHINEVGNEIVAESIAGFVVGF